MRFRQVKHRTDRNNPSGINLLVREIVVPLDMIEANCLGDPGLLIQVHQIALQVRVVENAPKTALKMNVINLVEANQSAE
jgi:hypothetical protein